MYWKFKLSAKLCSDWHLWNVSWPISLIQQHKSASRGRAFQRLPRKLLKMVNSQYTTILNIRFSLLSLQKYAQNYILRVGRSVLPCEMSEKASPEQEFSNACPESLSNWGFLNRTQNRNSMRICKFTLHVKTQVNSRDPWVDSCEIFWSRGRFPCDQFTYAFFHLDPSHIREGPV